MMKRPPRKRARRNALLAALVLFVGSSPVYSATWKARCQNLFWFLRSPSAEVPFEKHQCHAGSCWIHAATGPFEAREGVPLSDSYLLAASQLERAFAVVDAIAASPDPGIKFHIVDGGNFLRYVELLEKYGAVPEDSVPFNLYSDPSRYGRGKAALYRELRAFKTAVQKARGAGADPAAVALLSEQAKKRLREALSSEGMNPEDVSKFRFRGREYTPQDFSRKFIFNPATKKVRTMMAELNPEVSKDHHEYGGFTLEIQHVRYDSFREEMKRQLRRGKPVYLTVDLQHLQLTDGHGGKLEFVRREPSAELNQSPEPHSMLVTRIDNEVWTLKNSWKEAPELLIRDGALVAGEARIFSIVPK